MSFEKYKEILMNGERTDWYGEMVPYELITDDVRDMADMVMTNLSKWELEISELRKGKAKETKQLYYDSVLQNVRYLPYTNNGFISDCYMVRTNKILKEIEESKTKVKPKSTKVRKRRTVKPKPKPKTVKKVEKKTTTSTEKPVRSRRTKNSNIIFGNKNNKKIYDEH